MTVKWDVVIVIWRLTAEYNFVATFVLFMCVIAVLLQLYSVAIFQSQSVFTVVRLSL